MKLVVGGGDHLRNLLFFNPSLSIFGVDRSIDQLSTLKKRNPSLSDCVSVADLTSDLLHLQSVDLIYSQAVLMHISETNYRFQIAIKNILKAAKLHVVMMENWTQHNFLHAIQREIKLNSVWAESNLYVVKSHQVPETRVLVLSKEILPFEHLQNYDQLLQGAPLRIH